MLYDLQRVFTRLAVCDMDAARRTERMLENEKNKDIFCRITLEHMADALDGSLAPDYPFPDDIGPPAEDFARMKDQARLQLTIAKELANHIGNNKLNDWFKTGPYAGLGRLAETVAAMDIDKAVKEVEAFPAMCGMARCIPLDVSPDAEVIEAQVFRDGLKILRRHFGMDKESRGM